MCKLCEYKQSVMLEMIFYLLVLGLYFLFSFL